MARTQMLTQGQHEKQQETDMSIERIQPGPRMSQAVIHGDTIYLAGQLGDPSADIAQQVRQSLAGVDKVLAEAGSDKSKILSVMIWLADMGDFDAMNVEYEAWLDKDNPPTRATGESRLATPDHLVEVIVVAAR